MVLGFGMLVFEMLVFRNLSDNPQIQAILAPPGEIGEGSVLLFWKRLISLYLAASTELYVVSFSH